jgi:hypothetical protein
MNGRDRPRHPLVPATENEIEDMLHAVHLPLI